MDAFSNLYMGFSIALSFQNVLYCFMGCLIGTIIGVLPGIGPVSTIAILIPFTFGMNSTTAIILLAGVYYGAMYGGSTTSILVNVPGESASIMTCLDGYQMARQGRAKAALATAAIGSFFAGTIGAIAFMFLAVPISKLGLKFAPPEYFALMLLALTMVSALTTGSPIKGIFMTILGLLLATIGTDLQTGQIRFTFGQVHLMEGIHFIVVALGMFGVAEVLSEAEQIWQFGLGGDRQQITGRYWITWNELKQSFMPYVRGTILGFFVGVLPGAGGTTATFLSYGVEKQISKHPEKFGKGAIEGVAGPEAANNAASEGAMVPLMTLGIPGSATTAVMLGAFVMIGLKPGPLLFENNSDLVWAIIASLYIGNVMLLILNLPLVNLFAKILDLPRAVLQSSVLAFCVLGVYSVNFAVSDVLLMVLFGIVGYFAHKHHYPVAPLLLALVLGDMMEQGFRRSLAISNGDWSIFVTRPITLVILIAVVFSLAYSTIKFYRRRPEVKESQAQ